MNNIQRANNTRFAIDQFAWIQGTRDEPESDNIVDLLTDLMHLCDNNDYNFYEFAETARSHFFAELREDHS